MTRRHAGCSARSAVRSAMAASASISRSSLAEVVLGRDDGWSEQRVRGMVGRGEQAVRLAKPLPVHLAYFTLSVDGQGRLETHDDIYGHHRRLKAALGLGSVGLGSVGQE